MFQLPPCSDEIKQSPEYKAVTTIVSCRMASTICLEAFGPAYALNVTHQQISGVACVASNSSDISKAIYFIDLARDFGAMAIALEYGLQS